MEPFEKKQSHGIIEFYYGKECFTLDFDKYVKVSGIYVNYNELMSRNGKLTPYELGQMETNYNGSGLFEIAFITGLRMRSGIMCPKTFVQFFVPEILIKIAKMKDQKKIL